MTLNQYFTTVFLIVSISGTCVASSCGDSGAGHRIVGNHVYYGNGDVSPSGEPSGWMLEGVDPSTFEIIDKPSPDDSQQFCEGPLILNYFGKDKKSVFYQSEKIEGADPRSFEVVGDGFEKDKRFVYFRTKKISNRPAHFHLLEDHNLGIATDGKDYFYRDRKMSGDGFELLSHGYAKNKHQVFHNGVIVAGAEAASFTFTSIDSQFSAARDKNHIFYNDKVVDGADPESFRRIQEPGLFKDKNAIYVDGTKIPESCGNSARYSEFRNYVICAASVYKISYEKKDAYLSKIPNANPNTFHEIGDSWEKDDHEVYYQGNIVSGVDLNSFETLRSDTGRDKNRGYVDGKAYCIRGAEAKLGLPPCYAPFQ